jgi:hypothetical protein
MKIININDYTYVMVSDISYLEVSDEDEEGHYIILIHTIMKPEGFEYGGYLTMKEAETALYKLASSIGSVIE